MTSIQELVGFTGLIIAILVYSTFCLLSYPSWKKKRSTTTSTETQNFQTHSRPIHWAIYVLSFPIALIYAIISGVLRLMVEITMLQFFYIETNFPRFINISVSFILDYAMDTFEFTTVLVKKVIGFLERVRSPLGNALIWCAFHLLIRPSMWAIDRTDYIMTRVLLALHTFLPELVEDLKSVVVSLQIVVEFLIQQGAITAIEGVLRFVHSSGMCIMNALFMKRDLVEKRLVNGAKNITQVIVFLVLHMINYSIIFYERIQGIDFMPYVTRWTRTMEIPTYRILSWVSWEFRSLCVFVDTMRSHFQKYVPYMRRTCYLFSVIGTSIFCSTSKVVKRVRAVLDPLLMATWKAITIICIPISVVIQHMLMFLLNYGKSALHFIYMFLITAISAGTRISRNIIDICALKSEQRQLIIRLTRTGFEQIAEIIDWIVIKIGDEVVSLAKL